MATHYLVCIVLALLASLVVRCDEQIYSENLFVRTLPDGKVLSHFQFKQTWNISIDEFLIEKSVRHFGMFPKSLGQIVSHYDVQEVHVSLTQGQWNSKFWGYMPRPSPVGAELWAWFMPNANVDLQWKGVSNALSGLICASLNFINPPSTYIPQSSFKPLGAVFGNISRDYLRYAALPREIVCTENFTPWKKLLPCSNKAGIASLFSVKKLYNSHFHSLGIDFMSECTNLECDSVAMVLMLSLTSVTLPSSEKGWSFSELFGNNISTACPLAKQSRLWIHTGDVTVDNTLSSLTEDGVWKEFDLNIVDAFDLKVTRNAPVQKKSDILPPPLLAHRYITGSGHEWGGLELQLHNHGDVSLQVLYLDMVPWFLRLFLHTLTISVTQLHTSTPIEPEQDILLHQYFVAARDRERSYLLELFLLLPPRATITLSIQFNRAFLRWNEHPPDAHHGFYINSAVLTAVLTSHVNHSILPEYLLQSQKHQGNGVLLHLHTEPLLVELPTPDFSMMFNVLCFVSTVLAIAFGSLLNLTTRVLVPVGPQQQVGLLQRLFRRLKLKKD